MADASVMNIPQAFALARQHHRAGQLAEAEAIYREILAADPSHADALHLLGVLAGQTGRNEAAVDFIRRAIALRPDHPEAHKNLGVALKNSGQIAESITAYRQAIVLKPDYAEAHKNLGSALYQLRKFGEAIAACRQAIALRPGAHVNNIDFHLTPVAPITVHGRVTLSNGSAPVKWPTAIYSHDLQAHFSDPAFGALRLSSACNWRTPDVEFRCRLVSGNSYRLHFQVDNVIWGEAPSVPAQEADVAVQSQQTLNIRLTQRPPDPPSPNQTPSAGLPTGKVLIHGACPSGHSSEWMIIRSEPAYYIEQNMGLSNCSHPTEWILPAGNYRFVASFPYVQHQARKLDDFLFSQATPVTVKQGQTTEIGLKVSTPEEIARLALQSLVAHR